MGNVPTSPKRLRSQYRSVAGWIWPQPLSSPCWVAHLPWKCGEPSNWSCSWKIHTWLAWAAGCAPWSIWTQCSGDVNVSLLSLKRQSCHPSRSNSRSGSTTQTVLHQFLECGWGIAQPKLHTFTYKESYVLHSYSSVLLWSLIHGDLPKPCL